MRLKSGDILAGEILEFDEIRRMVIASSGTEVVLEGDHGTVIPVSVFDVGLRWPNRGIPLIIFDPVKGPRMSRRPLIDPVG